MNKKRKKELKIQILELSMLYYTDELFSDIDHIKNNLKWIRNKTINAENIKYLDDAISTLEEVIESFDDYFRRNGIMNLVKKVTNTLEMIH